MRACVPVATCLAACLCIMQHPGFDPNPTLHRFHVPRSVYSTKICHRYLVTNPFGPCSGKQIVEGRNIRILHVRSLPDQEAHDKLPDAFGWRLLVIGMELGSRLFLPRNVSCSSPLTDSNGDGQ